MAKKKTKAVAKTGMGKAPAYIETEKINIPAADSGSFFPQIKLLQQLSPELDDDHEKYIKKAKEGKILVSQGAESHMLFDSLLFIPLLVKKVWSEWIPRKKGGGFVATYASAQEAEQEKGAGNEINVSIEYLCVSPEVENANVPMILSFNTPTKMKTARELEKHILGYNTMEGVTYLLTSKTARNKAQQKYYAFELEDSGYTDKGTYQKIKQAKGELMESFLQDVDNNDM